MGLLAVPSGSVEIGNPWDVLDGCGGVRIETGPPTVFIAETYSESGFRLRRQDPHALIEAVETSATLRRVDSLIYLHQLLKLWLAPHVVTSALMLALLVVHIIQVVFFATR